MGIGAESGDVFGELLDGYAVCPSDNCEVLEVFERMTASEVATPAKCPQGCGNDLERVVLKGIRV